MRRIIPEGLVQQVAVCYLRHGYWWYVTGRIPTAKIPTSVDRKLIAKYEIALTDRQRAYRKNRGLANMQYIRYRQLVPAAGHRGPSSVQAGRAIPDPRLPPVSDQVRGLLDQLPPQRRDPTGRRTAQVARLRPYRQPDLPSSSKPSSWIEPAIDLPKTWQATLLGCRMPDMRQSADSS